MDAVSLVIVATVLSIGSALVYLFLSEFEKRSNPVTGQKSSCNVSANIRKGTKPMSGNNDPSPSSQRRSSTQVKAAKQVPPAPESEGSITAAKTSTPKQSASSHLPQSSSTKIVGSPKQAQATVKASRKKDSEAQERKSSTSVVKPEPTDDEVDLDFISSSFGQSKSNSLKNVSAKNESSKVPALKTKAPKKKSAKDEITNYSPEQLFKAIAACNLSKDEVEIAIETLLNKIESGESNWQQPKSDPLQKLKKQLRDSEAALANEIHSHEQTRLRLGELKSLLHSERSNSMIAQEDIIRIKKDMGLVLEQTRLELAKQQGMQQRIKDESTKIITKLEQDKAQLQAKLTSSAGKETESSSLRVELDEKVGQIQRYELSNQTMSEKIKELETKLRSSELQIDQLRASKQHDDYEACARITDLESDRMRLDKALKDHIAKLNEVSAANNILDKSVAELQLINGRQEEVIKRQKDEREINETSMKRALCEMEHELKDLQAKLSKNSHTNGQASMKNEQNIGEVRQQELKVLSEMEELRLGLAALLPELNTKELHVCNKDWVQQYLAAVKQLAITVEELKNSENNHDNNNNDNIGNNSCPLRPKSPFLQSNLQSSAQSATRVGSPTSNGRSSKAESYKSYKGDKKMMETKLLELTEYVEELEAKILELEKSSTLNNQRHCEDQSKEHAIQRSKLEAQIKFGLDSLKMEHQKVQELEKKLSKFTNIDPNLYN